MCKCNDEISSMIRTELQRIVCTNAVFSLLSELILLSGITLKDELVLGSYCNILVF
jgi:hypothetical protein